MSSTPVRTEAAAQRRPALHTLALLFGLLAVPGSTIAWDLPAGGLWLGLPLALAALLCGARARRTSRVPRERGLALVGMVLAGLCLAQMAVWTLVSIVS